MEGSDGGATARAADAEAFDGLALEGLGAEFMGDFGERASAPKGAINALFGRKARRRRYSSLLNAVEVFAAAHWVDQPELALGVALAANAISSVAEPVAGEMRGAIADLRFLSDFVRQEIALVQSLSSFREPSLA